MEIKKNYDPSRSFIEAVVSAPKSLLHHSINYYPQVPCPFHLV